MCTSAVNSSPVPSIQVEQTLTFIAVCCYLFSSLIDCFTLLVGFSSNRFVWHSANLPWSWPEGRLLVFTCLQYKGVSKSALSSSVTDVRDRVGSKMIQKIQQQCFWPVYEGQSESQQRVQVTLNSYLALVLSPQNGPKNVQNQKPMLERSKEFAISPYSSL